MTTIIGIGSAGCNIAELFEIDTHQYKVKMIDVDIEGENCFSLKPQKSPEDYENNTPDLSAFLADVTEDVYVIVCGAGKVSGSTLKILKHFKNKTITIIYIRPDVSLLSNMSKLQDRVAFNVLQEYARSGVFKRIILFDNNILEECAGDVSASEFNNKINSIIHHALSSAITFETSQESADNPITIDECARIVSHGTYDIKTNNEKLYYNLNNVVDKCYNFVLTDEDYKNNGKLFKSIKDKMREKVLDNLKISYRMYSTKAASSYCYLTAYSRKIQE